LLSVRQSDRRPPPAGDMDRGIQQFDHGGAGHAGLQPLPCVARGSEPLPVRASVWLFRTRETGPTVQAPPVTSPRCDDAGFLSRLPTRQPLLRRQNPPAIQGRSTKLCRWAGSVLQLVLRLASADTRRVHRTGPVAALRFAVRSRHAKFGLPVFLKCPLCDRLSLAATSVKVLQHFCFRQVQQIHAT